ncbi:MAG: phosphatase PAP2 family protein [Bdellovibrionales bacterium]|nr:phosphatase PAP2 family protein [Oligoflexia bacterium]
MPVKPLLKKQALWLLLPTLLWLGLFFCRKFWYQTWCAVDPSPCVESVIEPFDRVVFQYHSIFADFISNLLQNGVGVAMILFAWLLLRKWILFQGVLLYLVQVTLWNGALLEATRALVQRPRPLVFRSPLGDGAQIGQYTSFYSGHTSFVAMATFASFLWISRAYPRGPKRWIALSAFVLLTTITGILRILGGRHFPTDVLGAMLAGMLVALAGFAWARKYLPQPFNLDEARRSDAV